MRGSDLYNAICDGDFVPVYKFLKGGINACNIKEDVPVDSDDACDDICDPIERRYRELTEEYDFWLSKADNVEPTTDVAREMIRVAAKYGNTEVVSEVLQFLNVDIRPISQFAMDQAAKHGDQPMAWSIDNAVPCIPSVDDDIFDGAMEAAAANGHISMIEYYERGNKEPRHALQCAYLGNHYDVVEKLLELSSETEIRDALERAKKDGNDVYVALFEEKLDQSGPPS